MHKIYYYFYLIVNYQNNKNWDIILGYQKHSTLVIMLKKPPRVI